MIPKEFVGLILFKVANALHHAHSFRFSDDSRGIAHLDLSPGNILINEQLGLIKISDFGVASTLEDMRKKSSVGVFIGKPAYICPELVLNERIDFTVDLYSLGVIIYQLLTGICPNRIPKLDQVPKQDIVKMVTNYQKKPLIPPHEIAKGVDKEISAIVMTMMEYKRENRYSSARKIRDLIGKVIYKDGYGPTEHSFALYLTKIKMSHFINVQKDEFGRINQRKSGRRDYDKSVLDTVEVFDADLEPLWLHNDALKRFSMGENPCREV